MKPSYSAGHIGNHLPKIIAAMKKNNVEYIRLRYDDKLTEAVITIRPFDNAGQEDEGGTEERLLMPPAAPKAQSSQGAPQGNNWALVSPAFAAHQAKQVAIKAANEELAAQQQAQAAKEAQDAYEAMAGYEPSCGIQDYPAD